MLKYIAKQMPIPFRSFAKCTVFQEVDITSGPKESTK